ncbi:hypothetical protein KO164_3859 [Thalassospira sp. KO164]|nr:hypothetical protein KO164_3859 [Thalassospira sp. KO164]SEE79607.1 hypothetical protein SAMN04515623_3905 [Thalassospira permensis]
MDVDRQKYLTGGLRPALPDSPRGASSGYFCAFNRPGIRPPCGVSSAALLLCEALGQGEA